MNKPGVEQLLISCVLDGKLLQRLRESPEIVLGDYQLADETRDVLLNPDRRFLDLLGEVVQRQTPEPADIRRPDTAAATPSGQPPNSSPSRRQEAEATALAQSRLALRLVPHLQQTSEETSDAATALSINYAAHLDPLPPGTEVDGLPDLPPVETAGAALPPLAVVVTVQPWTMSDAAGNRRVAFSVTAQLPQETNSSVSPNEEVSPNLTPWRHDTNSGAVQKAAQLVHESDAETRYDRIIDLIQIMVATPSARRDEQ